MTLNEYQDAAMSTCMLTCKNISYMLTNLVGEVGEFAGKLAKAIRKDFVSIGGKEQEHKNILCINWDKANFNDLDELSLALRKEAGDVLWQLAGLCEVMGWTLEDIAKMNLEKLAARKAAGTISGDGDGVSGAERHV